MPFPAESSRPRPQLGLDLRRHSSSQLAFRSGQASYATSLDSPRSRRSSGSPADLYVAARWHKAQATVVIAGCDVPIGLSHDAAPPSPSNCLSPTVGLRSPLPVTTEASPEIDAEQLSHALQAQHPQWLSAFTHRFARDVGCELLKLHTSDRCAYLGLQLTAVRFEPPGSFTLKHFNGQRAFAQYKPYHFVTRGVVGFAPEEQINEELKTRLGKTASLRVLAWEDVVGNAFKRTDTFSWAASVAAFAIGAPLMPRFEQEERERVPLWVEQMLDAFGFTFAQVVEQEETYRHFLAHGVLDLASERLLDSMRSNNAAGEAAYDPNAASTMTLLQQMGRPWPQLHQVLGPLFAPVLRCFELQQLHRPMLHQFFGHLLTPVASPPAHSPNSSKSYFSECNPE